MWSVTFSPKKINVQRIWGLDIDLFHISVILYAINYFSVYFLVQQLSIVKSNKLVTSTESGCGCCKNLFIFKAY